MFSKCDIKDIVESQLRTTVDLGAITAETFSVYYKLGELVPSNPPIPITAPYGTKYLTEFKDNKAYFGTIIVTRPVVADSKLSAFTNNAQVMAGVYSLDNPIEIFPYPFLFQNFNGSDNVLINFVGYGITLK